MNNVEDVELKIWERLTRDCFNKYDEILLQAAERQSGDFDKVKPLGVMLASIFLKKHQGNKL
jgi:hypothetical protein